MAFVMRHTVTGAAALISSLLLSATGAAGTAPVDASFSPGPSLPAGPTPSAVVTADFNGDGSPDLAVANAGYHDNLRVLLNDGSGRFHMAAGSPFEVGKSPSSIAAADLNGDGKRDLAVTTSDGVAILLGDGAGRFAPAPGSPAEIAGDVSSVAAADLNSDGRTDLVVANFTSSGFRLRVLLNDGSGRFSISPETPPATSTGGDGHLGERLADLNGDGVPDLVAYDTNTGKVWALLNDGTACFTAAPGSPLHVSAIDEVVTADFNGDGKVDLGATGYTGSSSPESVSILLGDGSGRFQPAAGSPFTLGGSNYGLLSGDFNRDGRPDLASANPYADPGRISVFLGQAGGGFKRAAFAPFTADEPVAIAAADFDADGRLDLFAASWGVAWWPTTPRPNTIFFQLGPGPQVQPGKALPAKADTVFASKRPITALAADTGRAAVCGDFGPPLVWNAIARKAVGFKGECYGELAIGGGKVAWTTDYCGNSSCDTSVFVAPLSGGRRHEFEGGIENYCGAGPCDLYGEWAGQLMGAGPLLVHNDWWVDCIIPPPIPDCEEYGTCVDGCDAGNSTLRVFGQGLELVAPRRKFLPGKFPARAVGGGRVAVEPADGIVVLSATGKRLAQVPAVADVPSRGVALSANALGVLRRSTLELYNPVSGAKRASLPLGGAAGLQLAGLTDKLALLKTGSKLVLLRLNDGKLVTFPLSAAAVARFVDAKLTAKGLFYAYNLPKKAKARGRIVFEPTAKLLARF
jgi:FG-GAP-like repeat